MIEIVRQVFGVTVIVMATTEEAGDVMLGIVTWFNVPKGYGEILSESGKTYFFTYLELPKVQKFRTIDRGRVVEFKISEEVQFNQPVAKSVRPVTSIAKKYEPVIDHLRRVIS